MNYQGKLRKFLIKDVLKSQDQEIENFNIIQKSIFIVNSTTNIIFERNLMDQENKIKPKSGIDFNSVGGLERQIKIIRETIELPLMSPEIFYRFGILSWWKKNISLESINLSNF